MRKSKKLPPQTAHNKARGCSPVPVQHFIPHGTCSVTHMDPQVTGKRARDDGRRRDIRDDAAAIADDMATAALSTASSRTKQSEDSTTSVDSSNASCSGSSVIARPRVARVSQARERRASPPCSRPPVIVTADSTDEAAGGASRGASATAAAGRVSSSWGRRLSRRATPLYATNSSRQGAAKGGLHDLGAYLDDEDDEIENDFEDNDHDGDDDMGEREGIRNKRRRESVPQRLHLGPTNGHERKGIAEMFPMEEEGCQEDGQRQERMDEDEEAGDQGEEDEQEEFYLELADLPDNAIANTFFSGFLDSLQVAGCLRLVSKRMMAIGNDACRVMDVHGIDVRDEDVGNIATAFPHLSHLDLSFCRGIGGGGVSNLIHPCRDTLHTLILRGTGATDADVDGLSAFRHLKHLNLSQSYSTDRGNITPAGLEALMGLHHLERLGLAWNKGVTDDVIEQLCGATSNLRELDVGLCDKLTVRSLQALSTQPRLKVLSIQACRNVTDDGVEVLVAVCPGLRSLDLAHLPLLTGRSLNSLMSLTNLKALDVRCCELLSAVDVTAFRLARPNVTVTELRTW